MTIQWLLPDYYMTITWLFRDYYMTIQWLFHYFLMTFSRTFPGLEITALTFHDFSRFSMSVWTLTSGGCVCNHKVFKSGLDVGGRARRISLRTVCSGPSVENNWEGPGVSPPEPWPTSTRSKPRTLVFLTLLLWRRCLRIKKCTRPQVQNPSDVIHRFMEPLNDDIIQCEVEN